jgi:hypothetical protein
LRLKIDVHDAGHGGIWIFFVLELHPFQFPLHSIK